MSHYQPTSDSLEHLLSHYHEQWNCEKFFHPHHHTPLCWSESTTIPGTFIRRKGIEGRQWERFIDKRRNTLHLCFHSIYRFICLFFVFFSSVHCHQCFLSFWFFITFIYLSYILCMTSCCKETPLANDTILPPDLPLCSSQSYSSEVLWVLSPWTRCWSLLEYRIILNKRESR